MCRRLTPGSLMRTSASVPRPIDEPGRLSGCRVPLTSSTARGWRCRVRLLLLVTAGLGAALDAEPAGAQVVGALEHDRHRAREHVVLLLGVLLELLREVLDERRVVRREPVEVGRPRARRGSRWVPRVAVGSGSARCCRTRARGPRRSRRAARRCGRRGRTRRRPCVSSRCSKRCRPPTSASFRHASDRPNRAPGRPRSYRARHSAGPRVSGFEPVGIGLGGSLGAGIA